MVEGELHKDIRKLMKDREEAYMYSARIEGDGIIDYDYLADLVIEFVDKVKAEFPIEDEIVAWDCDDRLIQYLTKIVEWKKKYLGDSAFKEKGDEK